MLPSQNHSRPMLIKTKFSAPQLRVGLVSRPRLIHRLSEGAGRPLTLICAPAGYGKTTLLAEWIASLSTIAKGIQPTVCWLSLDQNDNDPAIFMNYLMAAFHHHHAPVESAADAALSVFPLPPIQTILGLLINELVDQSGSFLLVLDDYQFIAHPAIQEGLAFFLEHLPANVHMVMLTRSDPAIPLARLRARGLLSEIRAEDLRFTLDETTALLNQVMGLGLTVEQVAQLDERTEGWVAGLQMAALALASQPEPTEFVKNFSGSHRYILDYLIEEVLSHQPEPVQEFLLQTSILENLCAPLCEAVTGKTAVDQPPTCQPMLEYLERANLFLIPLDSERNWYRYHHLFADLLRARLNQQNPALARDLHIRAAHWYEQNLRQAEAIHHALASGAFVYACDLIEAQVPYRITHNGMGVLLGWIHKLPAEMTSTRPWLCIAQAWSFMFLNEPDQEVPLLQAAERNIPPETPADQQNQWRGQIACLWAGVFANIYDQSQQTIDMARRALTFLPPENMVHRTYASYLQARMWFLREDFSQALPILIQISQDCMQTGATNYLPHTLSLISKICRIEGRLKDSLQWVREGCAYIEACDPRQVTIAGLAFVGQVDVLQEWNRLDEAETLALRLRDLLCPWKNPTSMCIIHSWLARIYLAQGRLEMAETMLNDAQAAIYGRRPMVGITSDLNDVQVLFWLAAGAVDQASRWASAQTGPSYTPDLYPVCQELNEITLARVRIAEGNPALALLLLNPLAEAAERCRRFGRLIQIHSLQALALQALGEKPLAYQRLDRALELAEPEGYLRIFLELAEAMHELLADYLKSASPKHKVYAQKILLAAARGTSITGTNAAGFGASPADAWQMQGCHPADALTAREIEVLQGMVEGFSNRQIANQLILAEGTVKFYIHSVYEKLGAHNRTQALIEAKKRKLI